MKRAYVTNLLFSYSPFAVQIVVTIAITPYAVHILGEFEYGVFILFHTVLGYLGMANVGIPQTLMRRLIAYQTEQASGKITDLISTVFFFYLGITVVVGTLLGGAALAGRSGPLGLLTEDPISQALVSRLVLVIFLVFAFDLVRQIFDTIIVSQNKIYLSKLLLALLTAGRGVVLYLVLTRGGRIYEVVFAQMLMTGFFSLVFFMFARRELHFHLSPNRFRWRQLADIMPDSFWYLISGVGVLLIFQTDSLVISAFIGVSAITGYALVYRFVGIFGQMLSNIVAVLFPEVARMFAAKHYRQILRLHDRLFAYMGGIALACFGGLYLVGEGIFALWMGDLALFDRSLFIIFLITNALFVISIPATYFLGAVGWHRFSTSLGLVQGVVNVGLSVVLVGPYGVVGVALGTLISFVLTNFIANIIYFRKRMRALARDTAPAAVAVREAE